MNIQLFYLVFDIWLHLSYSYPGCVYLGGVFFCFVYILRLPSRPFHKTAWAIRQARAHYKAEKSPKFLTRPRHAHDCTDFPQNSWADYGRAVWAECKQSGKTLPPIRSLIAVKDLNHFALKLLHFRSISRFGEKFFLGSEEKSKH